MTMLKAVSAALLLAVVSVGAHATSPGELRQKHLNEVVAVKSPVEAAVAIEADHTLEGETKTSSPSDFADIDQEKAE